MEIIQYYQVDKMNLKKFDKDSEIPLLPTDYHIHTTYCDGSNTPEEYVQRAIQTGMKEIAFADHVWRTSDWVDDYVKEIYDLRKKYPQIRILAGVEAKALNRKGDIDASEDTIKKVDFVMGVCHRMLPLEVHPYNDLTNFSDEEAIKIETEASINLLRNDNVTFLGHPGRTYYKFFHKPFPEEALMKIVKEAKKLGKPLELNTNLPWVYTFLETLIRENVSFVIGSDSHTVEEIGNIDYDNLSEVIKNAR